MLYWSYVWAYIAAINTFDPLFQRSSLDTDCNVPSIIDMQPIALPSLYQILSSMLTTLHTKWKLSIYINPLKFNMVFLPFWFIIFMVLSMIILQFVLSITDIILGAFTNELHIFICPPHVVQCCFPCSPHSLLPPGSPSYLHPTSHFWLALHLCFTLSHTPCYHARRPFITPFSHPQSLIGFTLWLSLIAHSCWSSHTQYHHY